MNKLENFPKKGILHFVSDDKVIYSINEKLFYRSTKINFEISFDPLPNFNIINRILRRGIHKVIENNKFLFIIFNKQIKIICIDSKSVLSSVPIRGSRPLVIEKFKDGIVYGEYAGNKRRKSMSIIFINKDGKEITIKSISGIRHIHSITYIENKDKYIVTTGDRDHESKIMIFDENFRDFEIVAEGNQSFRVVQPILREDFIYFGTDIPHKKNYIYKICLSSGERYKLGKVPGPVFFGIKKNNSIFFSTVVEPSSVNDQKFCYILQIDENDNLINIAYFKKDVIPMKLGQYGQIIFPRYDISKNNKLFFTEFSTKNHLMIGDIAL
jgi:hypothetical protein